MTKRHKLVAVVVLALLTLVSNSTIPFNSIYSNTISAQSSPAPVDSNPASASTYGIGLSGGPVIMDTNFLASLEGNPPSMLNMERNVSEYFTPVGINLVFLDIGWGDGAANTSRTLVMGGYNHFVADWLQVGELYNIKTIFFFKQLGYFGSAPSWDVDFLNAYPSAATTNASGVDVSLNPSTTVVAGTGTQNEDGQNVLAVASTNGFFVGEKVFVFVGFVGGDTDLMTISSIQSGSPGTLTFTSNLGYNHAVGDPVRLDCNGCTAQSGWTITSPDVYRQMEQDLKQLYIWYGSYSSWIGFGEGATGDRNNYAGTGSSVKTSRPWDNGTIDQFANSIFFQRSISSAGYYLGTNTLSDVWGMFLKDQPDTSLSIGIPVPSTFQSMVFSGSSKYQRFYIPFGTNLHGFSLLAYLATSGSPTAPLTATIYNDDGEFSNGTARIGNQTIASQTVFGVTSSLNWVQVDFTNTNLVPGDFYWVKFSSSTNPADPFLATFGNYSPAQGISGSVLWIKSLSGQTVTIYPILGSAPNWPAIPGAPVSLEVNNATKINMITFYDSDRAYDPNNVSFYITDPNNNVVANGTMCSVCWQAYNSLHYVAFQLNKVVT
ncbi:MAG: hypothetical protein ACREBS_02090, partial [Nitrososphaerales archaeon]